MTERNRDMEKRMEAMERQLMRPSTDPERHLPSLSIRRRQMPSSLLEPPSFARHPHTADPTEEVGYLQTHIKHPRAKPPAEFDPRKDDIRIWIMELQDYFAAENTTRNILYQLYLEELDAMLKALVRYI
jgi:hypothetical protein